MPILLKSLLDEEIILQGPAFTFSQMRLFPLVGKIADTIWSKERVRGFHFTKPENISGLKSMAGKQKGLAISTRVSSENMRRLEGPVSRGMGVWIEGDVVFKSWKDLGSQPDKQGRRWIQLQRLDSIMGMDYADFINNNDGLRKLSYKIVDIEKELNDYNSTQDLNVYKNLEKELAKAKGLYVKMYLDETIKWAKKNLPYLQMYARDVGRAGWDIGNDEYIVTNIKLIDAIIFDLPEADNIQTGNPAVNDYLKKRREDFEKMVKDIKSTISGKLVIAPSLGDDRSGEVQKKFFKDRMS